MSDSDLAALVARLEKGHKNGRIIGANRVWLVLPSHSPWAYTPGLDDELLLRVSKAVQELSAIVDGRRDTRIEVPLRHRCVIAHKAQAPRRQATRLLSMLDTLHAAHPRLVKGVAIAGTWRAVPAALWR